MLEKIGEAEINGLLVQAATTIREQEAEIIDLKNRLAARDRHEHAEKIASAAVDRGLMDEADGQEYARSLAESDKDLSMVEDLVKRSAKGVPLGHTKTASAEEEASAGGDVLTQFLTTHPIPE